MDVTRIFNLQATFQDGKTFVGFLTIDVTAGSVGHTGLVLFIPGDRTMPFFIDDSFPQGGGQWQIIANTSFESPEVFLNLMLLTGTPFEPGTLVGYRGGPVAGTEGALHNQFEFTGSFTPSVSSPAGDLRLIADHDSTRTVIGLQIENANLQTSQVIAVVGSNVAFDGAADFNNDGLSDLLAQMGGGGPW
jgi:hypothetical protein